MILRGILDRYFNKKKKFLGSTVHPPCWFFHYYFFTHKAIYFTTKICKMSEKGPKCTPKTQARGTFLRTYFLQKKWIFALGDPGWPSDPPFDPPNRGVFFGDKTFCRCVKRLKFSVLFVRHKNELLHTWNCKNGSKNTIFPRFFRFS